MRLVLTGGGTGGHIYPALEVGKFARRRGAELLYLGSLRGQEGEASRKQDILFQGFGSEPLYSLKTPKGWWSAVRLLRATAQAKNALHAAKIDVVFSTGGYSAAPVMAAARSLRIPYMIHEANSVPGRANRMFADTASAVTSTFYATAKYLPNAIRTGQPIREELRAVATDREEGKPTVLVLGGSQGSAFLNSTMPSAAALLAPVPNVIHAAGKGNYQEMAKTSQLPPGYRLEPYLETTELVEAYRSATVAVARSGGTLAEFAMFGLPSVLVPLPTSADDHQLVNAREFVDLGGASLVEQKDASPESLSEALRGWLDVPKKRLDASAALRNWDVPDATDRIVDILFSIPPANYPSHA